jgi:hypothetical protein
VLSVRPRRLPGTGHGPGPRRRQKSAGQDSLAAGKNTPPWPIVGAGATSKDSEEEALKNAMEDALEQACSKMRHYLASQDPPISWTPGSPDIVKKQLFVDVPRRLPETEVDKQVGQLGKAKWLRWEWTLNVSREQLDALRQEGNRYQAALVCGERHTRAVARMEGLAKLTAWSVLAILGVFGYLRVDQWTAGTKRGWLRVGLASLLVGSGIGWWLLS